MLERKQREEVGFEFMYKCHCSFPLRLRIEMIQSVKNPVDTRLQTRTIRIQKHLFESSTRLLLIGADVDGKGLTKIVHVRFAVQLRQITIHHQFEQTDDLSVLTTQDSITFDAQFLEAEEEHIELRSTPGVAHFWNSRVSMGFLSELLFVITRTKSSMRTS